MGEMRKVMNWTKRWEPETKTPRQMTMMTMTWRAKQNGKIQVPAMRGTGSMLVSIAHKQTKHSSISPERTAKHTEDVGVPERVREEVGVGIELEDPDVIGTCDTLGGNTWVFDDVGLAVEACDALRVAVSVGDTDDVPDDEADGV